MDSFENRGENEKQEEYTFHKDPRANAPKDESPEEESTKEE